VGNVVKTQMSQMQGFEGTYTMEKIQAEWVVREVQYLKAKTCLEKVYGFVVKAKLFVLDS
jgi:hypothetical protein